MLGRLFGNAASNSNSANFPRDSVVDEEYTRGLLYPDRTAPPDVSPYPSQIGSARVRDFDDWSGLELDAVKDFRIIVGQDALGDSEEPCVLFDTHPIPQSESPIDLPPHIGSLHSPAHRRGGSTTSALKSPLSPLFIKPQPRASDNGQNMLVPARNRSSTFSGPSDEHDPRYIRSSDSKEETRTILNCAFGSPAGASSGAKMHILSLGCNGREPPITAASPSAGASMSLGYFRKREPIARAHTFGLPGGRPMTHERSHSSSSQRPKFCDAVLITKLFSVNLPEPMEPRTLHLSDTFQDDGEIGTHAEDSPRNPLAKGKKPRAKKTPVFAIILVVQLPTTPSTFSRPSSRTGIQTPQFHSAARSVHGSFSSYPSSPQFTPFITPIDRGDARVNALVEHWDVVDRALTLLETTCVPKILERLEQVDSFSAALITKPSKPKGKTTQRTNQISIYLSPLALSNDPDLKGVTMQAVQRIRRALRIPRVAVGQGRWGLWNDELIRTARSFSGKEQSSFIVNLLTSFLGSHAAEWMALLAPSRHHRRRAIQRKSNGTDKMTTRTVIVSHDRSIARRLIFLLSSFLASDELFDSGGTLFRRTASSVSLRNAVPDSPSLGMSSSIRRSRSPDEHQTPNTDHPQGGLFIKRGLHRKPSGIHTVQSIPIPAVDLSMRKCSTATTCTVTPNSTTPVPQFAPASGPDPGYFPDESSASARLNKIWRDATRDAESSTTSTNWGSFMTGFWSKDSSASTSESTVPSTSSSVRIKKGTQLDAMVSELAKDEAPAKLVQADHSYRTTGLPASKALPVKLEVDADKGVIDVDIGIPGFLSSSNDSGFVRPPTHAIRHVSSVTSFDSLAHQKRHFSPPASSSQSRVAGFLPRFHPDYSLQAVRVTKSDLPDLIEEIKSAMSAEPFSPELRPSEWVDVSTTLIANAQTASIHRLRLKRKISRLANNKDISNALVAPSVESTTASRHIKRTSTRCGDSFLEESFSYESVVDLDPLITDAIERVLSRDSHQASRSISPGPFTHSRHASTGTNGIRMNRSNQHTLHDPRSPDRLAAALSGNAIVGALEDVVFKVNQDLAKERQGQDVGSDGAEHSPCQARQSEDNALREGVRSWLLKVEQTAVW